jgi:hypothetical protein
MKAKLFWMMAVIFLVPTMALAQEEFGARATDWELTLQASGNSDDDFDNHNAGGEASIGYFLTDALAMGLRQDVTWVDREDASDDWNGATRVFVDYNFNLERLRPFIGVSAGYLYGDTTDERWIAGPEAGLKYYVARKTFLYLLGEYNFTFEDTDEVEDVYDDGRFQYALGFGFNW